MSVTQNDDKPSYFSDTLNLVIFCRQGISIVLF